MHSKIGHKNCPRNDHSNTGRFGIRMVTVLPLSDASSAACAAATAAATLLEAELEAELMEDVIEEVEAATAADVAAATAAAAVAAMAASLRDCSVALAILSGLKHMNERI
jgi:hypothetical protein